MPSGLITNVDYQKEPKFNGVYSRSNSAKIKDGVYVINLDGFKSIGTHWIALYVNAENVTYFDSFGIEHIPKEIRKFIRKKNYNKYFWNISLSFNNMRILLYWIY